MSRRLIYTRSHVTYTPPSYTPTANTLSYFKLNGDVTDQTGNNNGTATNISYVDGMYSGSLAAKFTGGTSKINCGSATNLNVGTTGSLTFIAWIKVSRYGAYAYSSIPGTVVKRGTGSGPNNHLYFAGGDPPSTRTLYLDGGGTAGKVGTSNFSYDQWEMISYIWDRGAGLARLNLNGSEIGSVAFGATTLTDTSTNLWIGCAKGTQEFFTGYMCEVIIENIAWSAATLATHYNTFKP